MPSVVYICNNEKMLVWKKQLFEGDGAEIASSSPLDIGSLASVGTDFLVHYHLNHPLVRMASFKLVISCCERTGPCALLRLWLP